MMHSSPITLGKFEGENPASEIIETILEYLGADGTLVVPTFNFDFCKGFSYDRQKTPSKNMGVLSETVRLMPDAKRSIIPMQSVAAIGKSADDICERDTITPFSPDSSFDRLLQLHAKLLLFGVTFNAATFFHYVEEKLQVPYRFFKDFSAEYVDKGVSEQRTYRLYVRDLDLNPQLFLSNLQENVETKGKLYRAKLGSGEILSCSFVDLYETACEMLFQDELVFVKNRAEVTEKLSQR